MVLRRHRPPRSPRPRLGCSDLLRFHESNPALNQAYETLMTNLRLLNGRQPPRTLLVTSTQPEEGKTTVVVALALALARARRRVLVVDADLRRPAVHLLLPVENREGLSAVVDGRLAAADAIQSVEIPVGAGAVGGALSVVTSGPPGANCFQALQSAALGEALRKLGEGFDIVLVDSPPVLSVSDPVLLAPLVDGVVLVLQTGMVDEKDARQAKERLERAGGRVLGVVMNHFDERLHGPSFHPYHAYYAGKS